jgi:hypothetical protein
MKDLSQKFIDYCQLHQTRYASPDVARVHTAESFFAGAAAMASLFAEGGFKTWEERAEKFAKLVSKD